MLRHCSIREHWLPSTQVANGILVAAGVSSILVLLNFLYHYGWVADRHFTSTAGIVWYFVPPAAFAFVCFGALRLTPTHKQRVAVLCLASALLLYGGEVLLDATDRGEDGFLNRLARARSYGKGDARNVNQVVADLRRSGVSAVRAISTPTAPYDKSVVADWSSEAPTRGPELMPLGGIARRPTVACHHADRWFVYDSDEHGFQNPLGLWKRGQVDIAAVGNSVTLGSCVPADRNFVSLIRVLHPATVNLAMNGEGPLQILAITKEYLSVLQPKILIWFYFEGNSLRELQEEKKYELLLRYVNRAFTQGLIGRQVEIDQALSAAAEKQKEERDRQARENVYTAARATLHRMSKLTSLRNAFGLVYGTDRQAQSVLVDLEGPTMELFRQIVASMKNQVSMWGGTLVFAYLPSSEGSATWRRPTLSVDSRQRPRVLQVVAEEAIPVIDLHTVLQGRVNSLFQQGRVNEEGHRLIAQHVLDAIASLSL